MKVALMECPYMNTIKNYENYMATVERFLNGWFVFDQNKIQWDL